MIMSIILTIAASSDSEKKILKSLPSLENIKDYIVNISSKSIIGMDKKKTPFIFYKICSMVQLLKKLLVLKHSLLKRI